MSDRDLIIGLLKKIERRTRANRFLRNTTAGISLSLLVPLSFKLVDLVTPFRGRTVVLVLVAWGIASVGFIFWRLRGHESLADIAARLDQKAELHDQIRTAYWFIRNPSDSPWVDAQIQGAARSVRAVNVDSLYPRFIPKSSYIAALLVLLLVGLNFVPLHLNHNWLLLDAAPAFSFSDAEQKLLQQAQALLKKAEALDQSKLAEKVEDIANELQEGKISIADALRQLSEVEQELDEGNLDLASINQGLDEIAQEFGQSKQLQSVADSIAKHDLKAAGGELQRAGQQVKSKSSEAKQMQERLQQASEKTRPGIEELSKDLQEAADALGRDDEEEVRVALEKASQEFDKLSQKMQSQQLKNEAAQRLQNVQSSLQQRQQQQQQQDARGGNGDPRQQRPKDGQPSGQPQSQGASAQQPAEAGEPEAGAEGAAGGEAQPGGDESGGGQLPSKGGGAPQPLYGAPTKLNVQLEQEQLLGQSGDGTPKPDKTEEASKQERSKLDYRSVPSELTPAQKDLLNQDRMPWEYRQLIKQYFEAIRPPQK